MNGTSSAGNREDALRTHDKNDDYASDMNKSAIENGNLAVRYMSAINGGAAIAILGFIGALASKSGLNAEIKDFAASLIWFAIGVFMAAVAMALAYCTNLALAERASRRRRISIHPYVEETTESQRFLRYSHICRVLGILCFCSSAILFLVGIWSVKNAIEHFAK